MNQNFEYKEFFNLLVDLINLKIINHEAIFYSLSLPNFIKTGVIVFVYSPTIEANNKASIVRNLFPQYAINI